jgi:hypothetical protein
VTSDEFMFIRNLWLDIFLYRNIFEEWHERQQRLMSSTP